MSSWTYVGGLIEVDTFAQTDAETIFKVLPVKAGNTHQAIPYMKPGRKSSEALGRLMKCLLEPSVTQTAMKRQEHPRL